MTKVFSADDKILDDVTGVSLRNLSGESRESQESEGCFPTPIAHVLEGIGTCARSFVVANCSHARASLYRAEAERQTKCRRKSKAICIIVEFAAICFISAAICTSRAERKMWRGSELCNIFIITLHMFR